MYSSDTKYLLKCAGIEIHTRYPTSPISLQVFFTHFGLKYRKIPLDKNTCGMLVRSVKGKYFVINANHPYTRRRFSLAHEIGHFFLGHDSDVTRANDQSRIEEIQANKFSSSLLMPDELFYYVHKENFSIKTMAQWLRVSPVAVAIRCIEFGIRQMEAEIVRSEYYFTNEIAAIDSDKRGYHSDKTQVLIKPLQSKLPPLDPRFEGIRKQNEETLDRLLRVYGYE